MVLMLLRTGMRIGELLSTKIIDVDLKERKVLIFEGEKNCLGRVVYFSNDAQDALNAWLKKKAPDKELLFYAQGRNTFTYSGAPNPSLPPKRIKHCLIK